jgi:hypothetical protein
LAARAARSGRSLQVYLLRKLASSLTDASTTGRE